MFYWLQSSYSCDHWSNNRFHVKAVIFNPPNAEFFNTVPHVVVTPTIKIFLLQPHNCNFAIVMNQNVNFWYAGYVICKPCDRTVQITKEVPTHRLKAIPFKWGTFSSLSLHHILNLNFERYFPFKLCRNSYKCGFSPLMIVPNPGQNFR